MLIFVMFENNIVICYLTILGFFQTNSKILTRYVEIAVLLCLLSAVFGGTVRVSAAGRR